MTITVEQVDREAAANLYERWFGGEHNPAVSHIHAGTADETHSVQAFAHHRIEATRQLQADLDEALEALEEIAASAYGNGSLSRDRDAHTLSMIEKHARNVLSKHRREA